MAAAAHSNWRRVFACVLIYALVLQGFIFAVADGLPAIGGAEKTAWSGLALCAHSGGGSTSPDAPSQNPIGDNHCLLCIAGAVYLDCPPPATTFFNKVVLTNVAWPLSATRLIAFVVNENAWPRGPPAAA
jgi:hypothetical protein